MAEADNRTTGQRIADTVAEFGGSWSFILSGLGIIFLWVLVNSLAVLGVIAWDKYPFTLLNLFLSLVAAFQAPFILMSQHRAEQKQDEAYRELFEEVKDLVKQNISQAHSHQELLKLIETHEKRSSKRLVNLVHLMKISPGAKIDLDAEQKPPT